MTKVAVNVSLQIKAFLNRTQICYLEGGNFFKFKSTASTDEDTCTGFMFTKILAS